MSKDNQQEKLQKLLMNPSLKSGLYLIDTDLEDDEIEEIIKRAGGCTYIKESLVPTRMGSTFELFVIGLSHQCEGNQEINFLRSLLITADSEKKDNILYDMLILMMKHLCIGGRTIIHVYGEHDLSTLSHEDLYKIKESLTHHNDIIVVASKNKELVKRECDPIIKTLEFKEQNYRVMENRLDRVHISYKHDDEHRDALEAIKNGLDKNNIPYSIDEYDILYRDNIEDYEKEIGLSGRVIMFVIPSYLKSLACMFEMTQMFKNGNVRQRLFPVVDLKGIRRDGDGLKEIKDYWHNKKCRKSEQIMTEPGGSEFILKEIQKIDEIINTMNKLWDFLVNENTGDYKKLIENDAALLMEELKRSLPQVSAPIDDVFVPSGDTKPTGFRTANQYGEKSIIVENNNGNIIIN